MPTDTFALSKVCSVERNGVHKLGSAAAEEMIWYEVRPTSEEQLRLLLKSQYGPKCAFYAGAFNSDYFDTDHSNADHSNADTVIDRDHIFIDFSALTGTREHVASDLVIACQTGLTVKALNNQLASQGQFFPVDTFASDSLTLCELILRGDGGYLENGYGFLRSQVLGLESVCGQGEILKTGGRVLKNVTGFDVGKLIIGSQGSLAFPYLAYLRLYAIPEKTVNFCVTSMHSAELLALCARLLATGLPLSALEIIEANGSGGRSYQLYIQISGPAELVGDVSIQVEAALATLKWLGVDEDHARAALTTNFGSTIFGVEVAASLALIRGILDRLISIKDRGLLRIRPSSGRLYLHSDSDSGVDRDLALISTILNQCRERNDGSALADWESLVVAAQRGPYRFSSRRLREAQPALELLLGRLKEKFDPAAALSPQVTFV